MSKGDFKLATHKTVEIGGSLMVVLPRRWVENRCINKGDKISFLLTQKGSLTIDSDKKRDAKKSPATDDTKKTEENVQIEMPDGDNDFPGG